MPKKTPCKPVPHVKCGSFQTVWKRGLPPKGAGKRFLNGTKIRVTRDNPGESGRHWTRWALLCDIRKCPCRHYATKKAARDHFPGSDPKRILITLLD